MKQKENKFVKYLQENPNDELVFICFLWFVIFVYLIQLFLLLPLFFEKEEPVVVAEPILAVVLVDSIIVGQDSETYLSGYRLECHPSDISNVATTPNVNANLTANSYLKYTYTISNYTKNKMIYWVDVVKDYEEKNLTISYTLDGGVETDLQSEYIAGQIDENTTFVISLYVKIANSSFDADLSGKFALNITYFAD